MRRACVSVPGDDPRSTLTRAPHADTQTDDIREFLAAVLRGESPEWPSNSGPGGARVLEAACAHRVEMLAALQIHRGGRTAADWPPVVRDALLFELRTRALTGEIMRRELARVLAALDDAGLRPVLFKGAALAFTHYPDPAARPRLDADVLIGAAEAGLAGDGPRQRLRRPRDVHAGGLGRGGPPGASGRHRVGHPWRAAALLRQPDLGHRRAGPLSRAWRRVDSGAGHGLGRRGECPEAYRSTVGSWEEACGFDGAPGRLRAVNAWRRCTLPASSLLVEPRVWAVLDYLALQGPNASGDVTWMIERAGEAHGLCRWFDCDLAPGCRLSNSPLSGESHVFGQGFFQWPQPCTLEPGDQVHVTMRADLVGEDYIWSWDTDVRGADGHGPAKAEFRQSQFLSAPLSAEWLRRSSGSFVPSANREAVIDTMILALFSEGISLETIARRLSDRFPERFSHWRKALTRVGHLSMRYSD